MYIGRKASCLNKILKVFINFFWKNEKNFNYEERIKRTFKSTEAQITYVLNLKIIFNHLENERILYQNHFDVDCDALGEHINNY